jgi:NEDD8-activating enzyme E1 regulatory subunit|tara:strand:- start:1779 stop:2264 length:486 start_codon:yes stop_codon:yes gene_type:complete
LARFSLRILPLFYQEHPRKLGCAADHRSKTSKAVLTIIQVNEADLGRGKASTVAANLQELNTSVAGSFVDESPDDIVHNNPAFFESFTVILATQMSLRNLVALDVICRQVGIPLVALQSYGLTGTIRLSLTEHTVLDAKPEESDHDLRLSQPWPVRLPLNL